VTPWAVALLAVLLLSGVRTAVAETVRVSGSGAALGTMRNLGEAFRKSNPRIRIELLPGMGSAGSIKAVLSGRLDIGLSARRLNAEERAGGLVETKYAKTPFVFGVNDRLKMTGITVEGAAAIYAGKRDWENGNRIRLVLRPGKDSDIPVLKSMSPAMREAVDVALRRGGMIVAMTDQDAADALETVPGAFGGTTLSLVLSEKRAIRVLSLGGVTPSVRTLAEGSYPHSKTFSMVTKKDPPAAVRRFIDFVRSPPGASILAKNGQEPLGERGVHP